ncbi:MAG: glycosyltransferase [Actinomycetota bacterium]|jgi:dolichol-phosphate mannosyltransferase|nr:glycosyltransferase [Actinomycetota bacterium]
MSAARPDVSIVIPMYQEVENAAETLRAIGTALSAEGWSYELVPVNDGSTDGTEAELSRIAAQDPRVQSTGYIHNRGRGYALRRGFAHASGSFVAALDADLSYTPEHAVRMVRMLMDDPEIDIVLASPYMPGGRVEGVSFIRLLFSRGGNWVLRRALAQPVYTSTGVVRAYRRETLDQLDLSSDGKEIHLEILSQAMALGMRIVEMPATLTSRKKGKSKFRPRRTVASHLVFSMLERPAAIFGAAGLVLFGLAAILAIFLLTVYAAGDLNPERPLMTLMVLLFLGGTAGLSFALLGMQMIGMRRQMVRMQSELQQMRGGIEELRAEARGSAPANVRTGPRDVEA